MKYKYQGFFPVTLFSSNIDEIKDTKIEHVDMSEFVEKTQKQPLDNGMKCIVQSNI